MHAVKTEKPEALTAEQLFALKQEHGPDLVSVTTGRGPMVFKKPNRAIWADFMDGITKDRSSKEVALRRLCMACVVLPSATDANELFNEYPALPSAISVELGELAGAGAQFDVKKV